MTMQHKKYPHLRLAENPDFTKGTPLTPEEIKLQEEAIKRISAEARRKWAEDNNWPES